MNYEEFLRAKVLSTPDMGIEVDDSEINPILKPHQRAIVHWALRRGRAAIFAAFSLGKSVIQLEIMRLLMKHLGGRCLIVAPLGARFEFFHDTLILQAGDDPRITDAQRAELYRWHAADKSDRFPILHFVQSIDACEEIGLYITNYESVRDGKIDPTQFSAVTLDEAAVLRGFGSTATFRELMGLFEGSGKYRFVATATPSPNDFIELLAYSAFLGIMDVSAAKTKFFKRNSEQADELTLMPSRAEDYWHWISDWAVFLQSPADLGFDASGYQMPEMRIIWHELPSSHENAGADPSGQGRLLRNSAIGLSAASREKRDSMPGRIAKLAELVKEIPDEEQFIVWCDLNDEQRSVDTMLGDSSVSFSSLYGNQHIDDREALMNEWRGKETRAFVSKPSMYGAGSNLQQAWREYFLGVNYKFYLFIQAVHRVYRYLQKHEVEIHIIYTEAEREIRRDLEEKWAKHKELVANMTAIIHKYGLGGKHLDALSVRKMEVVRQERSGGQWNLVNNDCVAETARMPENSVDLIVTSIPFSQQYEYSASFRDFGHNEDNDAFWRQMDFLIPSLFKVLRPGRVAAIHVKDRITPSGMTGMGFQTVYRFSDACCNAFEKHGFGFLARKTIVTDVVRENNQTYRLGWTEQCKDGSRMGAGMPEYLLLFRKPPTDTGNGYADIPVVKRKAQYTRSRWQIDAHGFTRSSGDRYLAPEDLVGVPHDRIFKLFRQDSLRNVYDFERHVALSESLEKCQECGHIHAGDKRCDQCECKIAGSRLPANFMLLQPQSAHEDVWTDVARMRTLNMIQVRRGREAHICPLQFDIVDRAINQLSMPGEIVFDPFSGIGTVPMRALLLGRKGLGIELSEAYFEESVLHLQEAERKASIPTLFDLVAEEEEVA